VLCSSAAEVCNDLPRHAAYICMLAQLARLLDNQELSQSSSNRQDTHLTNVLIAEGFPLPKPEFALQS
jgi:hypothetical protein